MNNPFTQGYACIIGVGGDLPMTVHDAQSLAILLQDSMSFAYPAEQISLLTQEDATRSQILATLDDLAQSAKDDSTVIVYFSGPGMASQNPTDDSTDYYLLTYGYDLNARHQTSISGTELAEKLRAIPANKLLLILDCSHAEGIANASISSFSESTGRAILAASRKDEAAYTRKAFGIFTFALIEGLLGKAATKDDRHVRISNLAFHAVNVVPEQTRDRQHPMIIFNQSDDFVIGQSPFLESPPVEIIQRGPEAIRQYLQFSDGNALPLNEVKLIFVGDGGAGKTSIVKALLGRSFDENEKKTHGINIEKWMIKSGNQEVKIHMWDFGGQDIMHATHQFFLSERSLYILVLDGRKEEDAEYWLKHVESFGGTSPILVVMNRMDENPSYDVNRRFLQTKYSGVFGFYRVSAKTCEGIASLKDEIIEALSEVDIVKTSWPASWFRVKEYLESIAKPFISYDDYVDMCASLGVNTKEGQEALVQFLHDLGVIVHFDDFRLTNTHVLEPRWLTAAVYTILNSPSLANNFGILDLGELPSILPRGEEGFSYPRDKHLYIIDLMKKFQLCYSIDNAHILIPDLLPVQEPEIPSQEDCR